MRALNEWEKGKCVRKRGINFPDPCAYKEQVKRIMETKWVQSTQGTELKIL